MIADGIEWDRYRCMCESMGSRGLILIVKTLLVLKGSVNFFVRARLSDLVCTIQGAREVGWPCRYI